MKEKLSAVFWKSLCSCNNVGHILGPYSPKHAPPSLVPGKGPGQGPSHGLGFPLTKTVPNSILQFPKMSVLLKGGGETVAAWCALQTPPTIRIMFSSSCFDTLLMAIICCPHKYDGLLKDPQDAA